VTLRALAASMDPRPGKLSGGQRRISSPEHYSVVSTVKIREWAWPLLAVGAGNNQHCY
jgi:hypothetical protein